MGCRWNSSIVFSTRGALGLYLKTLNTYHYILGQSSSFQWIGLTVWPSTHPPPRVAAFTVRFRAGRLTKPWIHGSKSVSLGQFELISSPWKINQRIDQLHVKFHHLSFGKRLGRKQLPWRPREVVHARRNASIISWLITPFFGAAVASHHWTSFLPRTVTSAQQLQ